MRLGRWVLAVALSALPALAALGNTMTSLPSGGAVPVAGNTADSSADTIYVLTTPGSYTYGNGPAAGTTFYDNYYFSVSPSQIDSITASVSTPVGGSSEGITNPMGRLFSWNPNQVGVPFPTGSIPAGSGTLIVGWGEDSYSTQTIDGSQFDVASFSAPDVAAGYYVLQISGTVDPLGGNYTGSLNLSPAPLPASWLLMAFGISLMGAMLARRGAA